MLVQWNISTVARAGPEKIFFNERDARDTSCYATVYLKVFKQNFL